MSLQLGQNHVNPLITPGLGKGVYRGAIAIVAAGTSAYGTSPW
ncbi:MAG: hypothetical protein AAFY20_16510 [Cyanobacteria bacterium J06639_14]